VIIAVLIGFALSRGPDKPEVAFYNGLEGKSAVVELGGDRIDLAKEGSRLFDAIDPVRVDSREEAIQKVKDGDVLGALIIPSDLASNIQSQLEPGRSRSITTPRTRRSSSSSRTRSRRRCRPPTARSRSAWRRRRSSSSR
jgi:hypothetical protein